jgi:hypothetical protein
MSLLFGTGITANKPFHDDDDDQNSQNSESLYYLAQKNRAEIQGAISMA